MSRFPDNFDAAASGIFAPDIDVLASQMGSAVSLVDTHIEELMFHIAGMASPPDAEQYDVDDAKALAAELGAIVAKRRPGRPS